jgi:hypothetical protein
MDTDKGWREMPDPDGHPIVDVKLIHVAVQLHLNGGISCRVLASELGSPEELSPDVSVHVVCMAAATLMRYVSDKSGKGIEKSLEMLENQCLGMKLNKGKTKNEEENS